MDTKQQESYNIITIINDLKATCYNLETYLRENGLLQYKNEIEKELEDAQEIAKCDNCGTWVELGEMDVNSCESCGAE